MLRLIEPEPEEPAAPRSRASMAYGRLKADILAGQAGPGDTLKITDIAVQLENGTPNPDGLDQHEGFHRALVGGCESPRLLAVNWRLYLQLERYGLLAWQADLTATLTPNTKTSSTRRSIATRMNAFVGQGPITTGPPS